ncbi:MAG: hypothetical protein H3Z53_01710 [archaeon]|nr:hypothetical protein [archaeon]MCP8313075.1 hypothetical protein [archaeon]
MKLYPLNPNSGLATNIRKISKKLGIKVVATKVEDLDRMVVITNGTPDDMVFAIISHHLNGDKTVRIVKPNGITRLVALDLLKKTYLKLKINKIMFLIDQETDPPDQIFEKVKEKLSSMGISIDSERDGHRFRIYECRLAGNKFKVIIVVNGLDDIPIKKHTIEDHLIKIAEIKALEDTKKTWLKLDQNKRDEIFKMVKDVKTVKYIFPQQIEGCKYLMEE